MASAPASETKISELENDIIHKDETIKDLRKYHVYFFLNLDSNCRSLNAN